MHLSVIVDDIEVIFDVVFLFFGGDVGILDSFGGAVGYARHAVGAWVLPAGFLVLHADIFQRTDLAALAAAYTFIGGMKVL